MLLRLGISAFLVCPQAGVERPGPTLNEQPAQPEARSHHQGDQQQNDLVPHDLATHGRLAKSPAPRATPSPFPRDSSRATPALRAYDRTAPPASRDRRRTSST